MDVDTIKELGTSAGVIAACIWGAKILLGWFTKTLDKKDELIAKQQEQVDRLVTELMNLMRETQAAHAAMIVALNEARLQSTHEHQAIVKRVDELKAA